MEASKKLLMKKIIDNNIFKVASSPKEEEWILLKNGSRTPLFLNTAEFHSFPEITEELNRLLIKIIENNNILFDKVLGLPYGGLLFGYGIINILKIPSLSIRKEGKKNYSTKGDILGLYKKGERVLLIEDATVTAQTAIGFVKRLREKGLIVNDIITVVDIGKEAKNNLKKEDVNLYCLFTWKELYNCFKIEKPNYVSGEMKKFLEKII